MDLPPDHVRVAVHHLKGRDWKHHAPTTGQIGPEHAIQRLVRTGGHDDSGRIHSEPVGDLGLQRAGVGIFPELGQVRRCQILEELAWWRIPLVSVELEYAGLRLGRARVEIPGDPGRGERCVSVAHGTI